MGENKVIKLINLLLETAVADAVVLCNGCGWEWELADGGKDPYLCHKCGTDNTPEQLNEKCWKGYTKKGMKTMFGKKYPNCVKK